MTPAGWTVAIVVTCVVLVVAVLRWIEYADQRDLLQRALAVVQDMRTARGFPERQRAALRADHLLRDTGLLSDRAKEVA